MSLCVDVQCWGGGDESSSLVLGFWEAVPGTGVFAVVAAVAAAASVGAMGEVGPTPPGITRLGTPSPCTTLGGVYGVGAVEMNLLLWC